MSFLRHTRSDHHCILSIDVQTDLYWSQSRGTSIFLAHVRPNIRHTFELARIIHLLGEDAIYKDVAAAMERVEMVELAATREADLSS